MIDLLRLPDGTVLALKELTHEERVAHLEALIHLSAPAIAELLAGGVAKPAEPNVETQDLSAVREQYADLPPILTVEETAKVLKVGRSAVYEMTRRWQGKFFPHFKMGNRIRIPRDKLIEWIHNGGILAYKEEIRKADEAYERSKVTPKRKY